MNESNKIIDEFINKIDKNIDNLIDYLDLKDLILLLLILIIISLILYFSLNYWFNSYSSDSSDSSDSSKLYFDNMAVYYINLDRSFDRRMSIEKMCNMNDIKSERVQGVDGKLLNLDDPKYEKALKKIKWWFLIENKKNVGHFGCYLSHMKVFKRFLETDKKYCLIMEDDAEFIVNDIKKEIIKNIKNLPRGWDILLLGYEVNGGPNGYDEVKEANKETKLENGLLNLNYFTGLHGYIINRNSAKKLIENLQYLDWIIDWNMGYLAKRGLLNIYGVFPPLICQPAVHMIEINDINYQYNCKIRFDTLTNK